jgi:DNA repair exonuclease SbcCD ATPase subunit
MTTPAPVAAKARPQRPKWQTLLGRTLLRLHVIAAARRGLWSLLVLAAAYAAFLLTVRLTGLLRLTPEALALAGLPVAGLLIGMIWPRRPTLKDAARAVDRHAKTDDLFLTMLMLENSPGEFQPLVAAQAEAKAGRIRSAEVVPMRINGRLVAVCVALLLCAGLVPFVPQLDPFGRVEASQQAEKEAEKLDETKKATKERLAQIDRESLSDAEAKEVKDALDKLKMSMNGTQPKAKTANALKLSAAQKDVAEQWRKISSDKLKDLLSQSSLAQQFGSSAAGESKKWLEELQAGSTDALKKEMKALQQDMEELAKSKDPVKKAQLQKRLREKLDAMAEFAKDQTGSKTLAAAIKRAQEQMRMASKGDDESSSQESMRAAAESMKLAEKELEQVAQSAKDLKELEKGLAVLQMAKKLNQSDQLDGKKCEGCQSMDEYAAMFEKMMKGKNPDEGGFGDGGTRDEKDSSKSKFKTEMSKSHIVKGKVLLTLKTKGMGEHVEFKEQYRAAVRDVKQGISEAILQEEIPPGYHEGIKGYFESLDETPKTGK